MDLTTAPPVVLHTELKMGLPGSNYDKELLSKVFEEMMGEIDTFE